MIIFSTGLEDFIDKFIAENKSIEVCPILCFGKFLLICRGNQNREIGLDCDKNNIPILWLILIILYRLGMIVLWLNIDVFIILNIGYI